MTQHIEEALIGYVMRYGGMCRDCADMDGVCQSGMPCDTDQRRAVIRHTIAALAYGINNGFIASPFTDTTALAAAEERGRIEERERCAIETGGVLVEMPSHLPNLMARVLAYLEGSDPKATSGGERNSDLRDGVRKVLEASK